MTPLEMFQQAMPSRPRLLKALCQPPRRPHVPWLVQPGHGGIQPTGEAQPGAVASRGQGQHIPEGRGGHGLL